MKVTRVDYPTIEIEVTPMAPNYNTAELVEQRTGTTVSSTRIERHPAPIAIALAVSNADWSTTFVDEWLKDNVWSPTATTPTTIIRGEPGAVRTMSRDLEVALEQLHASPISRRMLIVIGDGHDDAEPSRLRELGKLATRWDVKIVD